MTALPTTDELEHRLAEQREQWRRAGQSSVKHSNVAVMCESIARDAISLSRSLEERVRALREAAGRYQSAWGDYLDATDEHWVGEGPGDEQPDMADAWREVQAATDALNALLRPTEEVPGA